MINKISSVENSKVYLNTNFKSEKKAVSKPIENKEFGTKPLANYALASIDLKNKLKVTPLIPTIYLPEAVDSIKGERIYTSAGELHAIVDENDETRTVYHPVEGRDDAFKLIITYDKKTGNIIREQYNEIEGNEHKEIQIYQYSPETGEEIAYTNYEDGELEWASKTQYKKDGSKIEISYDYDDKEYSIYEFNKEGQETSHINMSQDLKFLTINSYNKKKNKSVDTSVDFYNGAMISYSTTTSSNVPNMAGLEPLMDEDLTPEEIMTKEELQALADTIDGEKTFFSNGKVESIKGKLYDEDVTVRFNIKGEVIELSTDKISFETFLNNTSRTDFIDENTEKTTIEYNKGGKSVTYIKDDTFKKVNYSEKGKLIHYTEGEVEEDGERDTKVSLHYNDDGMLKAAYNF